MTNEGDELETRLVRLEENARRAREEAGAALALARGADNDVSLMNDELRAHTGVLNALRETQLEHGELLRAHGERLDRVEQKVDNLERKVDDGFRKIDENFRVVEEKFAVVGAGLAEIKDLLTDRGQPDQA